MKLIKIFLDRVQIKADSEYLKGIKINTLLNLSDGKHSLALMVVGITTNDAMDIVDPETSEYLGHTEVHHSVECTILGSIVKGTFTKSVDEYPSPFSDISIVTPEAFQNMLSKNRTATFDIGEYVGFNTRAEIDGNRLFQRHFAILGNTGAGKSVTLASLVQKLIKLNSSNTILFDIHGEYKSLDFVKTIKIGNDGMAFPIWFLPFRDFYSNILRLKDESATLQLAALRKTFYEARQTNKNEELPIAFDAEDMLELLKDANEDMIHTGEVYKTGERAGQPKYVKGENTGKLSSTIALLEDRLLDERYKFLFKEMPQDYLYEFVKEVYDFSEKNVKVIDLSDAPSDIVPMLVAVITRLIYSVHKQQERENISPVLFVMDEAHNYIPSNSESMGASNRRLLEVFEELAKEGRKFAATLAVVTQRPSELNKTILAMCANYIVLKITNAQDISLIKGLLPESSSDIINAITLFSPGDAFIIGDACEITMKVKIDLPSQLPDSNTVATFDRWGENTKLDVYALVDGLLRK